MTGLTIVVVAWNTRVLTTSCLAEAARAAEGYTAATGRGVQTVLVDNGSRDGTVDAARTRFPEIEILALPGNRGFAAGANAGAARARGDVLLFLNTDARIDANALIRIAGHLDRHPHTGLAGPQLLHADGRLQHSARAFPSLLDELLPDWLLDRLAPQRHPAKRRVGRRARAVESLRGAALFARRQDFEALGGFRERFFFYLEETDLCWRARAAGIGVDLVPEARVVHLGGSSSKRVAPAESRIEFHRSLYHFLAERRGPRTAGLAVALRTLRGGATVLALAAAAPISSPARARLPERWALLRWHLAGRPAGPGLAGLVAARPDAAG